MHDPTVRQVWMIWATDEPAVDATGVEPRPQDWDTCPKRYLALIRVE